MSLQNIFFKSLFSLFLLLGANHSFAFSFPVEEERFEASDSFSSELSEKIYHFSDSALSVPPGPQQAYFAPVGLAFSYKSIYVEVQALAYIKRSGLIVPSLAVPDIIFPFHFFL